MFLGLEDFLTDNLEQLRFESAEYQRFLNYIGCFASLEGSSKARLLNALAIGLKEIAKQASQDHLSSASPIEPLTVLVYAAVLAAEKEAITSAANSGAAVGRRRVAGGAESSELLHLKLAMVDSLKTITDCHHALGRLYQSSSELEHLVGAIVKTVHALVENVDNYRTSSSLVETTMAVLANCATGLRYRVGMQTFILQDLNHLEHLSEFNGELLAKIYTTHGDPSLVDAIFQHIGAIRYNGDDGTIVKNIARFLLKLAITSPKVILKNITSIAGLADCDAYTLRMAMLEIYAVLITHNLFQEDRTETSRTQALSFLSLIEERLRDTSSFVRAKALQVLSTLVSAAASPITERTRQIELVLGRVMDKSSIVRKRAIQMLGELIKHHPFYVDGGELSLGFFEERLREIDVQLDRLVPSEVKETMGGLDGGVSEADAKILTSAMREEGDEACTKSEQPVTSPEEAEMMQTLLMQKRYYSDAILFVKQIDRAFPMLLKLLSSNVKTEVFEVMDLLVDAHIYGLQASREGVRRMMHLIWEQDLSTEDGTRRSIREHVLLCYRRIYLEVDVRLTGRERTAAIANNLLKMVETTSRSDLASLGEIITCFLNKEWIPEIIIELVHQVFTDKSQRSKQGRALVLLSMLGRARPGIITGHIETLIKFGLAVAPQSSSADPLMIEYTCTALRHCSQIGLRLPVDSLLFSRLLVLIRSAPLTCTAPTASKWLRAISEGVRTLYALCEAPSVVADSLIKELTRPLLVESSSTRSSALIKLLWVIGEVASNEVCHLNAIEAHYKAGKAQERASKKATEKDSMEGIAATEEDDFTDVIKYVRESELLYGEGSLLAAFGPMVATICSQNTTYTSPLLQNVATLTLSKLMAVSGRFCDQYLPLFLTLLEKSSSPIIRANLTVAFADLAQSFGRIIDTNISYLFRRLGDEEVSVRRSALLVLTHLSSTGMIKIKGQVGSIARCILDRDPRVANLAKMFFHELAGKDAVGGIYSHIPDMISTLTVEEGVEGEAFKTISRFIFEYVKRERQMEGLLEKLCQRIRQASSLRHAQDLAFCLTLINYGGERTTRKLIDLLPMYKDKLVDFTVYSHVMEAVQKALKTAKAELRPTVEEFKKQLLQIAGDPQPADDDPAGNDNNTRSDIPARPIKVKVTKGSSRGGRRRKDTRKAIRDMSSESEQGEEDEFGMDDGSELDEKPVTVKKEPPRGGEAALDDDHMTHSSPIKVRTARGASSRLNIPNRRPVADRQVGDDDNDKDIF